MNLIPARLSLETYQDSEPFLAVQTDNPRIMVASAHTPNNVFSTGNAPIYFSNDGGDTWNLENTLPVEQITCDVTVAIPTGQNHAQGDTHAAALGCNYNLPFPDSSTLYEAETANPLSGMTMSIQSSRGKIDQPFVQARTISNEDRIYVGVNDFNRPKTGPTATLDVSFDGGVTFKSISLDKRKTPYNAPPVRLATAADKTVYVAFFGDWQFQPGGTSATLDLVVVRDDVGGNEANPFQALKDPFDNLAGRMVVRKLTIPWKPTVPTMGQERIGANLSLAVNPNNSSDVYIGWGDQAGDGNIYTLHVRRSTDRGVTWSSSDLPNTTLRNAINIAIAVADNGVVGLLYQQFTNDRWVTHLVQSQNAFTTFRDTILATVPASEPTLVALPYLGDYDCLSSIGNEFRGVFSANNTPDLANFPSGVKYQRSADFNKRILTDEHGNSVPISIDPFYFSVPVIP
ncbi:MAG TPA: hypothetical protein VFI45_02615 [Candidatus Acidoferrum sp.]|nr:hypothetical protein [Candidatus Acidoferrum sp.]